MSLVFLSDEEIGHLASVVMFGLCLFWQLMMMMINRSRASESYLSIAPNTINFERLATELLPIHSRTYLTACSTSAFDQKCREIFRNVLSVQI